MINTLYKKKDGQVLMVIGHFNERELKHYRKEGYRFRNPDLNKHGILIKR